jgi:hypothetical protein
VSAAAYQLIELANQMETASAPWQHHPACELCAAAKKAASSNSGLAAAASATT